MELFLKLLRAGCFAYNDVVKLTGNKKTARFFYSFAIKSRV